MTLKALIRTILIFATVIGIGVALKSTGLGDLLDKDWIDQEIRGRGLTGEAVFLGIGIIATAIGLPRQGVSFLAGYAFGIVEGTVIAVAATAGGCIVTFMYARLFGRSLVQHRFPDRLRRFDAFLQENPFTTTLLIRFLPIGSNLLTNLFAGVTGVALLPYVAASAIGYIPQTLIFAILGSGFAVEPGARLIVSIVLFALSGGLGLFLYRRYRDSHHLANAGVVDAGDVGKSEVNS